jgi:hypothetical protein
MTTLGRPGVPAGGFKTIGQVRATNDLVFTRKQNAMGIAVELLTTRGRRWLTERGGSQDSSASSTFFGRWKRGRI